MNMCCKCYTDQNRKCCPEAIHLAKNKHRENGGRKQNTKKERKRKGQRREKIKWAESINGRIQENSTSS
jgi:hypothetical protein